MNLNVVYGRTVLADILPDVRKHIPGVRLKDAWVWHAGRDHWEFHYTDSVGASVKPNGTPIHGQPTFYWHGRASGAYEARAKGWAAYLERLGVEGYT